MPRSNQPSRNNRREKPDGRKNRPHPLSPSRGRTRGKRRPIGEARRSAGSLFARPEVGKKKPAARTEEEPRPEGHRVQKILAAAGYGSRRECEELISTGRVEIDGKIVTELGVRADPAVQRIRVDGEALPKTRPVYLAVNKPKGFLCTHRDQQGRRRVIDLVPDQFGRVFPVGRLDQYSEGLILLTNDGAFAEQLTHPRFEVPKKYQVQVAGEVEPDLPRRLQKGIHIAEGVVQADEVKIKSRHALSSILEIVLREGKNREIRRMLARIGHKVLTLRRIAIGPVKLGDLAPGEYRLLTKREVASLYSAGNKQ
ncbi:MAG: rRNA pseudouridine synthase [Thermoguttaceae bacterium]|nr:rRNA pseudouridine synthase [Thermoguttaceae bacterium]